jgi:hypothetical protein
MDLWGGGKSAAPVETDNGSANGAGSVQLDFGSGTMILSSYSTPAGLGARINIV